MLVKEFYRIDSKEVQEDGSVVYGVSLNTTHDVYKGHFPERPITPGVCNIQMIKELAEDASGRSLTLSEIDRCRLTAMVTPDGSPSLNIKVKIDYEDNRGEQRWTTSVLQHQQTTIITRTKPPTAPPIAPPIVPESEELDSCVVEVVVEVDVEQ